MHQTQSGLFTDFNAPAPETLSKKGFAERIGVTPARVSQMITAGLPVEPNGRIAVRRGLDWYEANVDSNRRRAPLAEGADHRLHPISSRAQRDAADARIAELKAEKLAGNLINRRAALRWIETRARMERDSWIAWTNRAAPALADATGADIAKILPVLDRMAREQLASLADKPIEGLAP
jgi:hypothetical protein